MNLNYFTEPNETHDIIFKVEDRFIYCNRGFISVYSPVFSKMFYSDFKEKNSLIIELKGINQKLIL